MCEQPARAVEEADEVCRVVAYAWGVEPPVFFVHRQGSEVIKDHVGMGGENLDASVARLAYPAQDVLGLVDFHVRCAQIA